MYACMYACMYVYTFIYACVQEVSRALVEMGVSHENEKVLDHDMVVDIWIPPSDLFPNATKGVVIEVDGPSHFALNIEVKVHPAFITTLLLS